MMIIKRALALCYLAVITQSVWAQTATEKAEKRLAELLAPGSRIMASALDAKPVQWKPALLVDTFVLPINPYAGVTARLPSLPPRDVKPGSAPEGAPLVAFQDKTPVPKQPELPTKPLIKLPSIDVTTPLPPK